MQKLLALFVAIILLVTPVLALNVRPTKSAGGSTSNPIIQNGGFEEGLIGWTSGGDGLLAVSSNNPHSGNYSLEISSSVSQQAYFYQYMDCPNASFVYSFWVYRADPISTTACYLGKNWDGNTIRVVSSLVIDDDEIELNTWDDPYAPGRQMFNYSVGVGSWHNITFFANATLGTQDFYIDGNLLLTLNSSSGDVFGPDQLIFGDVNTVHCEGHFYFDDLGLVVLDDSGNPVESAVLQVVNPITGDSVFNFSGVDKKVGDTFLVNVTVANVQRMVGWQFALQWDSSLLECVTATIPFDNVFAYWNVSGEPVVVAGPDLSHRGLVIYGAGITYPDRIGFNGSGVLAQVEFKILNKVGQSDLSFVGIGIGTFLLSDDLSDIWFVPISAQYSYSGSVIPGDVNMDGTVNMRDVQRMILIFNSDPSSPNWDPNADVNNDGTVNMRDIFIALAHFNQHA